MKKIWWKEEVIYQIYPRSFYDSDGDGIGDLRGIIEKLDYLKSLHVDILWLSPIFKSPNDDNGYDVSDYKDIMDEFGGMDDFDELLEGVHQRGMKLILDLVANHTSDEHEWFQKSRASKEDNPYRDYYIWKPGKDGNPPNNWTSFFSGSAWKYDELTDEYFLHLFTKRQPDLNWENPAVRQGIYDCIRFWFEKGVDGFRMDVIPLISKRLEFASYDYKTFDEVIKKVYSNGPRVHEFLKEMRQEVLKDYDVMALGEGIGITANIANKYVGEKRKELDLIYHFDHLFSGQGEGGKYDIVPQTLVDFKNVYNKWYRSLGENGWQALCLGNHDFARCVSRFGNDGKYWEKSAKLIITHLATMRGTLNLYQGDEIGMTNVPFDKIEDFDDVEGLNYYKEVSVGMSEEEKQGVIALLRERGRDNARTPIQWNDADNAGFTTGQPWIKMNPNYTTINVASQEEDPNSILNYYRKMLSTRKEHLTWVYGGYDSINNDDLNIYAYWRWDEEHRYLVVLNFSDDPQVFETDTKGLRIVIGNYETAPTFQGEKVNLRPWEAVIYQFD